MRHIGAARERRNRRQSFRPRGMFLSFMQASACGNTVGVIVSSGCRENRFTAAQVPRCPRQPTEEDAA
jgi:hypothetical protein